MMDPDWIVIFIRDDSPPRVLPYEREEDAQRMYDRLATQWTGVYLCRVVRDAGRALDEQPEPSALPSMREVGRG